MTTNRIFNYPDYIFNNQKRTFPLLSLLTKTSPRWTVSLSPRKHPNNPGLFPPPDFSRLGATTEEAIIRNNLPPTERDPLDIHHVGTRGKSDDSPFLQPPCLPDVPQTHVESFASFAESLRFSDCISQGVNSPCRPF